MYLAFFNLREPPFNLTPDPRFLFLSAQHEEALSHLLYGIYERRGFVEITGEVGTGKTVLCRALLERLDKNVSTALIFNSYLTKMELLQAITDDFGLTPRDTTSKAYIDALNDYLLGEFTAGRNAVVVIDEAQNLEPIVLEQLRMLSNLETERGKLLQIILVGQPELQAKLSLIQMRQLEQRIAVRFHIHALTRTETRQYITHRMSVAGGAHTVTWSRRALRLIHQCTGGIPRRINLLCDRILMTAFVRETHRVSAALVRRSVQDLASSWRPRRVGRLRRVALGSAAVLGLLGLLVGAGRWLLPAVQEHWYPRLAAQVATLTRGQAGPVPAPGPAPAAGDEPAAAIAPVPAAAALLPPPLPLEVDIGLAQTLWRVKVRAEEFAAPAPSVSTVAWESAIANAAGELGLDIMAWQAGLWQLADVTRPCFLELLPESPGSHPTLGVMMRGVAEGVVVYQEPAGLTTLSFQQLRRVWSGKIYLTLEESRYRGGSLKTGTVGEAVRILQQTLKALGYFPGLPSGQFDTLTQQAVKRFQRDNQLVVDGRVGRRTLMLLLHIGADIPA